MTQPTKSTLRFAPWVYSATTFVLLWLSYPPVGWSLLAWVAPVPLLMVTLTKEIVGRRPYLKIYLTAVAFWLAAFYFLPYPHPVLFIGWFALSAYLAVYTPLFIACARSMIHRWGVSPLFAIPVAWTGLEWIRVNFLTGFGMTCLSHTQYQWPVLIQISSLFGAYAVTFALTAFAAGLASAIHSSKWRKLAISVKQDSQAGSLGDLSPPWHGTIFSAAVLVITIGFGMMALQSAPPTLDPEASTKIALVQSSIDTILAAPKDMAAYEQKINNDFSHKVKWTHKARKSDPAVELVVWPESAFPVPDVIGDSQYAEAITSWWDKGVNDLGRYPACDLLTGTTSIDPSTNSTYNAAVLIGKEGVIENRYFKNHRVMIGEYTPILEYFPALMKQFPVFRNLTAGTEAVTMNVGAIKIAPSICFETTVPHLIREQLNERSAAGDEPDAMLNITNDGWFFGSSCLDFHLACNVFRAVEMGKPMLVCANTGLSAHIDQRGRILKSGPRRKPDFLICDVSKSGIQSHTLYRGSGAWVPFAMGWICVITLSVEFFKQRVA